MTLFYQSYSMRNEGVLFRKVMHMKRVTYNSIEKGRITLSIPPAYKETALMIDSEAQRLGKSFSGLMWELIDDYVKTHQQDFQKPTEKQ
jgi:hypothetical protein